MRYLVFDIECANCFRGNGKICSFGFVISDENFAVQAKDDIIINPQANFYLNGRHGEKEVKLAYTEEQFYAAAPFPDHYARIKELLEYPDQIVIGHAIANDVNYLNSETKRYSLQSFEFEYMDSHLLYADYSSDAHPRALDKIAEEFGIEFLPHRSDEDSYATLMYVKAICDRYGVTLREAIDSDHAAIHFGSIKNHVITQCYSDKDEERKLRMARADKLKGRQREFVSYIARTGLQPADDGALRGKAVCFDPVIQLKDIAVLRRAINLIYEAGGSFVPTADSCDIYVLSAESEQTDVEARIVTESEFATLIGRTFAQIKRDLYPRPHRHKSYRKKGRGYHSSEQSRRLPNNNKKQS